MRRVVADPVNYSYYESSQYFRPTGADEKKYYHGSSSYVPNSWVRSEITKVPFTRSFRAPTRYQSTKVIHTPAKIHATRREEGSWGSYWIYEVMDEVEFSRWNLPVPLPLDASLRSQLIYRALAKVKDEKINLAVTLAEIGSVVGMITKHAVKLKSAYTAAKQGNWKKAYDVLGISRDYKSGKRDLASGWLEIIYGWLPLIMDIHGGVEEINRKVLSEGYTLVGRARSEASDYVTVNAPNTYRQGLCPISVSTDVLLERTQKVSFWFRVDMPALQRAAALGVTNPLLVAWELTSFSFVADWFITIGDWLSSLDATVGLIFMGGSHTYRSYIATAKQEIKPRKDHTFRSVSQSAGFYSKDSMVREVISTTPEDRFVFTNPLSTSHAITAVALLVTSIRK